MQGKPGADLIGLAAPTSGLTMGNCWKIVVHQSDQLARYANIVLLTYYLLMPGLHTLFPCFMQHDMSSPYMLMSLSAPFCLNSVIADGD